MARYCGECGRRGHNRRTCPRITADYTQEFFTYKEQGEQYFELEGVVWDYYTERREHYRDLVIQRTGVDPETGEQLKDLQKKLTIKKTTCSYCQHPGHTRRVCKHLKEDIQVRRLALSKYRKKAQQMIIDNSIGVGGLVVLTTNDYDSSHRKWESTTLPWVITNFEWQRAGYDNNIHLMNFVRIELFSNKTSDRVQHISPSRLLGVSTLRWQRVEKFSPSTSTAMAPQYWLEAGDNPDTPSLKRSQFPTGSPRDCRYSHHAFKDMDHPYHKARKELGFDMSAEF